jgi:hypothetical protein
MLAMGLGMGMMALNPMRLLTTLLIWTSLALAAAEPHWAYGPLRSVALPGEVSGEVSGPASVPRHPVDAFIRSALGARGLQPAPEADRSTLLRRIHWDLVGLPPSPEDHQRFLADDSPSAYEREVDRLLASPRYGERWARHWMDAVHFAETHGHDQDRIREQAWPYRDYLVGAFNADRPYGRFIEEQVAGDVLFFDRPEATVALGMLAAGPWDESSLRDIREDTLDRQLGRYVDRDDMIGTVMSVFNSTTVQCARCHDHKFDPVPQADYYALQAVFSGVERAHRVFDRDPSVHLRRQRWMRERRQAERGDPQLLEAPATRAEVEHWVRERQSHPVRWTPWNPTTFFSAGGAGLVRLPDGSLRAGGVLPERDTYTLTGAAGGPALRTLRAVQLEVLPDASLPHQGPGRNPENGNLHLSEVELWVFSAGASEPRRVRWARASASFDQDGWTAAHAIDGQEKTAWGIHPQEGKAHRAVFELAEPLEARPGDQWSLVLRQAHGGSHLIGRFRVSMTDAPGSATRVVPPDLAGIVHRPKATWTVEERRRVTLFVVRERLREQLATLPAPSRVYAAAGDFEPDGSLKPSLEPRVVHRLNRGEITQPREVVGPGTLSLVDSLPARFSVPPGAEEGARRAALARWLAHRDNPLTWRSIVNRVWLHHFGRGLVNTPNDFGRMGERPSHPELLDWLAVWFRDEAGGSMKALHRLLLTSATYRQRSQAVDSGQALSVDPDNRWLARMNRLRLDAECVRDGMLHISGRLDLRMGGPGDRNFDLKPGIHVTPKVDYGRFDSDGPEGRRRSVYRFLFRTLPDPWMEALDCPAGDQLVPARDNSVTLQQALALWNHEFSLRQAGHWARALEAQAMEPIPSVSSNRAPADTDRAVDPGRVDWEGAVRWVWGRPPTVDERLELERYARRHGLANACRLLFNSNEFLFVP